MKPLNQKSYGSIPHLPGSRLGPADRHCHEGQAKIATEKARDKRDVIIVLEKLDGSNVGICKADGRIHAITRSGYLASTSKYEQHHMFDWWVKKMEKRFSEMLSEGQRLCGEWLAMAHGTKYKLHHEPFVAFDLMTGTTRSPYYHVQHKCWNFGITPANQIHSGGPLSITAAIAILDKTNGKHGAIDKVEGAIWRVERKGQIIDQEVDYLVKYVRHDKQDGKYFTELTGEPEVYNWTYRDFDYLRNV